jgi:hypothetical protein
MMPNADHGPEFGDNVHLFATTLAFLRGAWSCVLIRASTAPIVGTWRLVTLEPHGSAGARTRFNDAEW